MTGDDLKDAKEELGQNKQTTRCWLNSSDEGAKKFADLTSKNIGVALPSLWMVKN